MSKKQASLIFFFVALIYFVVWTIIPFFCEPNFRFDVTEMFLIGKEGVLATFKHPALNSIILELVYQGLGRNEIAPYLLNQVFFFLTAWVVWRVGCEFFTPFESLVGVLMFYCYWAYFYASLHYNHNIPLATAWAFITLFSLLAIKYDRLRYWVGLGVAIGLGGHCKITIIFLVFAILLFTLFHPRTRKYWLRFGVYLSVVIALVIASPIIYWFFVSDFSFVKFVSRYRLDVTLANRFFVLFDAILAIPLCCLSFIVLFAPLSGFRFKLKEKTKTDVELVFVRNFLLSTACIALFLMMFACFVSTTNRNFRDFTQIFIFAGFILIATFKMVEIPKTVRTFFIFFAVTMVCYLVGYSAHVYCAYYVRERTQYLFPGKELATKVEDIWKSRYSKPFKYITGDWSVASNVAIYSKDRPTCHCDYFGFPLTTWSTDQDILNYGSIAIWDLDIDEDDDVVSFESQLKERFPSAELLEPIELQGRAVNNTQHFAFGVAIIPPDDSIKPQPLKPAPMRLWKPQE